MSITPTPFQKCAADAVVNAFQRGRNRYLVADETGLGKTIIARAIIEKMSEGKQRFIVYYFGSNLMLLKDTITEKLAKDKKDWTYHNEPNKLGMMAGKSIPAGGVHIYGFSANLLGKGNSTGDDGRERPSFEALLSQNQKKKEIEDYITRRTKLFPKIGGQAKELIAQYSANVKRGFGRVGMPTPLQGQDITALRQVLELYTLETAPPDLIIFDEFHRYDEKMGVFLTRIKRLEQTKGSARIRILLLSATPYNYYPAVEARFTDGIAENEGEPRSDKEESGIRSFCDLLDVLDKNLRFDYEQYQAGEERPDVFSYRMRKLCIYRNERITDGAEKYLTLPTNDDFCKLFADCYAEEIELRDPPAAPASRYWKLCSGVYSFPLTSYKDEEPTFYNGFSKPEAYNVAPDRFFIFSGEKKLKREGFYWNNLRFACIRHYNAEPGRRLLWVPPSKPDYELRGPFQMNASFTKLMVFSAYRMVPRIVSGVFSAYVSDDQGEVAPVDFSGLNRKMQDLWGAELLQLKDLYQPALKSPNTCAETIVENVEKLLAQRCKAPGITKEALELSAKYIVGAPYLCAARVFGEENADRIGKAFERYFQKEGVKQAVACCGITTPEKLLDYCISGGLNAVLEEYRFSGGNASDLERALVYGSVTQDANHQKNSEDQLVNACSQVHVYSSECYTITDHKPFKVFCHYAERFNADFSDTGRSETQKTAEVHFRNCHNAFNSPFWPMILCTTAANQEGYDLDRYCSRIMHYSLPPNTMAFEQRDGRIDRRLSLLARRRMVQLYPALRNWECLFQQNKDESGMSPHWTQKGYIEQCEAHGLTPLKFERIVPYFPMTREWILYRQLMERKNQYRSHFGIPNESECGIDPSGMEPLKLNEI